MGDLNQEALVQAISVAQDGIITKQTDDAYLDVQLGTIAAITAYEAAKPDGWCYDMEKAPRWVDEKVPLDPVFLGAWVDEYGRKRISEMVWGDDWECPRKVSSGDEIKTAYAFCLYPTPPQGG